MPTRQGQGGRRVAQGDGVSNDDDGTTRDGDENNDGDEEEDDNDDRMMTVRTVRNGSRGSGQ